MNGVRATNTVAASLGRGWRIVATGICFATFGLGALLQGCTLWPLLYIGSRDRRLGQARVQRAVSRSMAAFVWLMKSVGVLSYEIHGRERLARRGQFIIANHPSLIDVVFLISLLPEVDCIVKEALWRNPFLRWPVTWAGYISNAASGEQLVENCRAALTTGRSLLMFPEGTRTRPGLAHRMQRGAAHIALAAGAPVRMVVIRVGPTTLYKGDPWYNSPLSRPHFVIRVLPETFDLRQFSQDSAPMAARHLTHQWEQFFDSAVGQEETGSARAP